MIIQDHYRMITIILLTKAVLNISLFWLIMLAFIQKVNDTIYEQLVSGVPSTIAQYLGTVYLIFLVTRKGVKLWREWRIAKLEVDDAAEKHKRSEILTEQKRKELDG